MGLAPVLFLSCRRGLQFRHQIKQSLTASPIRPAPGYVATCSLSSRLPEGELYKYCAFKKIICICLYAYGLFIDCAGLKMFILTQISISVHYPHVQESGVK